MTDPTNATRSRPQMQGYGMEADTTGMLEWAWIDTQMLQARNYWVCTTRPEGLPHAAPVWGVWLNGVLYFSSGRTSRKARNLAHRPQVVIHLESGDDVVIIEGTVAEVTDLALYGQIAAAYGGKYAQFTPPPDPDPAGIWYMLLPHSVLAWRESDFTATATRWTFAT
ncbi:MAG: pyridoxamine 5'-phosphate oxidase family protein [Armatimonadetes bacterium]|nr:pyridoxamine 5'-phosphate oxidase family protein [Anaerolineae bacterium]